MGSTQTFIPSIALMAVGLNHTLPDLELLLSPNDELDFARITPEEITLFRLESAASSTQQNNTILSHSTISNTSTLSHLTATSAKAVCIAWKPDKTYKHIFAVGFNNSDVILLNLSPNQRDNPPYINNIFWGGGSNRTCSSIAWNPNDPTFLAVGFPKLQRPDQSLRIWDTKFTSDQPPPLGGLGSLFPAITTSNVICLTWLSDSTQSLVYSNHRGIAVYDYSQKQLGGRPSVTKAIHGICNDTLSKLYVAGFSGSRVRVWRAADLYPHFLKFNTSFRVVSICWSPLRHSTLLALTSYPEIYQLTLPRIDVSAILNADPEEAMLYLTPTGMEARDWTRHLLCEPLHHIHTRYPEASFSFLPHPTSRSSFILHISPACPSSSPPELLQVLLPCYVVLAVSARGQVACASDMKLTRVSFPQELSAAAQMRNCLIAGYCFRPDTNRQVCREMGSEGQDLARLWEWMMSVETGLEGGGLRVQLGEVMLSGLAHSVLSLLQIDKSQYQYCDVSPELIGQRGAPPRWQYSPNRELCLQLLGWLPSGESGESLEQRLVAENQLGKAALYCVISDPNTGVRRAIKLLQGAGSGNGEAGMAMMALAGYPSSLENRFWVETCLSQAYTLNDPYLRLCVRILYSDYTSLYAIIRQEKISANDKFVLACSYLQDADLNRFKSELLREIQEGSLLEGIFLTGLGVHGMTIMENYLSQSGDLLTVSILSTLTLKYSLDTNGDLSPQYCKQIDAWWVALSDFLDQSCLWKERCRLQIARNKILNHQTKDPQSKWHIMCGFCDKRISGSDRKDLRGRRPASTHPSADKNVAISGSCCPSCHKPLPRCVVCHRHMGSSADHVPNGTGVDSTPTDDWITWCQSCGHWGHNKHLAEWFRENTCCPSPGCSCPCLFNDK